jgi:hypothetical protein
MLPVGFEPTIAVLERPKTVRILVRAATMIGVTKYRPTYIFFSYTSVVTLLNCSTQTYHPRHTSGFFFFLNNTALPIMRAVADVKSIMCASTLLLFRKCTTLLTAENFRLSKLNYSLRLIVASVSLVPEWRSYLSEAHSGNSWLAT